jgi:hypothetical protein
VLFIVNGARGAGERRSLAGELHLRSAKEADDGRSPMLGRAVATAVFQRAFPQA